MRPQFATFLLVATLFAPSALRAQASTSTPRTEAELDAEATRASSLLRGGKALEALPLYEDLVARRPGNMIYMEGAAMGYIARGGASGSQPAMLADSHRALDLFKKAQALGDHSDLSQVMMEKLNDYLAAPAETSPKTGPRAPGSAFEKAELAFSHGDMAGAAAAYKLSAQTFPDFYAAPLYAGDSEYKLGHYDEAGVWFAKAIAIDPDTETAHRYWADCLVKAGNQEEAGKQYLLAFIADPYSKAPRLSLRGWAPANKMRWAVPPITLPTAPAPGKDGNLTITLDSSKPDDPLQGARLAYALSSTAWQMSTFMKQFPQEKSYRHSLPEEAEAIKSMLTVVREQKIPEAKWDPSMRSLMALEKDGMVECWILLDNPDQGVAQDYLKYRDEHRDLLQKYVQKYDLHPV